MSDWISVADSVTGRTYYANMSTHETSWDAPVGFTNTPQNQTENEPVISNPTTNDINTPPYVSEICQETLRSMVHFDAVWDTDGSEGGDSWNSDSDSSEDNNHRILTQTQTRPIITPNIPTSETPQNIPTNNTESDAPIHEYPTPELLPINNEDWYWQCSECRFKNKMNRIVCKVCNVPKIKKHCNDSSEGQERNIERLTQTADIPKTKFILENSAFQDSDSSDEDSQNETENEIESEGWADRNNQLFSEIMAIIDSNPKQNQPLPHLISNLATQNNQNQSNNNSNQNYSNQSNNDSNGNNNGNNSGNYNGDNGQNNNNGFNNSGNGGKRDRNRDDNDKNKKYVNDNDNDSEDEEEDSDEEKNDKTLNENAKEFVPKGYNGYMSKPGKRRTLSPINEKQIYSHCPISVKPRKAKMNKIILTNTYDPNPEYRARFNVEIPREFTTKISNRIKEELHSLYLFMDKGLSLQSGKSTFLCNEQIFRVINYGFHDRDTNEILYCVITQKHSRKSKNKRNCAWEMIPQLFTAANLQKIYNIHSLLLPQSIRSLSFKNELVNTENTIKNILTNGKEMQRIVNTTAWHKIAVFNPNQNKNRKRMILKLDKPEFMRNLRAFVNVKKDMNLIPILMFDSKSYGYNIEYLWIVRIDKHNSIDIGISFVCDNNNVIVVSGIHLNKATLLSHHQLVTPHHSCQCLEGFVSNITDLCIGNPFEELNRIKDLTKKFRNVSFELTQKNNALDESRQECTRLQSENEKLRAMIETYNNANSSVQSTPELHTNVSYSVPIAHPSPSYSSMILPLVPSVPNVYGINANNGNNSNVQPLFYPYQMANGSVILIPNQVNPINNSNV